MTDSRDQRAPEPGLGASSAGHVTANDQPEDRDPGEAPWTGPLAVAGLAAFTVSQPLLDLFGRTPQYFVANDVARGTIVAWALLVAIVPATMAFAVDLLATRLHPILGRGAHRVLVTSFGAVLVGQLLRQWNWTVDADVVLVALLAGIAAGSVERRSPALRRVLSVMAVSPLLFLALFVFASDTSDLLLDGTDVQAVGAARTNVPVIVVVFDELPLASLLDGELGIDAARFPNFARLASRTTWYRNATSVSADTTQAVPAVLAGDMPRAGARQDAADHPVNVFTVTGRGHDLHVREAVTRLCPSSICTDEPVGIESLSFGDLLDDTAVVLGHQSLPPSWREKLPDIDRTWGGFRETGAGDPPADDEGEKAPDADEDPGTIIAEGRWAPDAEGTALREWASSIPNGSLPTTAAAHVLLPHMPWQTTPGGRLYGAGPALNDPSGRWLPDPLLRRLGLQRHLLQLGYADSLLGVLLRRLDETKLWDDAIVVVTADHGSNFGEGHLRSPSAASLHEVLRVPLFVHAPGQTDGAIDDRSATTLDVLPTIVDLSGLELGEVRFDGRSLAIPAGEQRKRPVPLTAFTMPPDLEGLAEVAERNATMLPGGPGWEGVYAVGPAGATYGKPAEEVAAGAAPANVTASLDQVRTVSLETGQLPVQLTGAFAVRPPGFAGREFAVAVNGTVAGAGFLLDPGAGGAGDELRFVALTDERWWSEGANTIELLVPVPVGLLRVPIP